MKKVLIVVLFVLFLVPSFVLAQDVVTPSSSVKVRIKNEINTTKPVRQDIRIKVDAKREDIRVKLSAKRKDRIRNFSSKTITRIEALIERLGNLIARLEDRITKINEGENNLNTTQTESNIAEAKRMLSSVSLNLAKMSSSLERILSSDDPKVSFMVVKDIVKEIKTDMRDIHKLLVSSIGELKGLRVGDQK